MVKTHKKIINKKTTEILRLNYVKMLSQALSWFY